MIVLVTGPPGAGKSFYAVRKIGQALDAGKPVATNIDLAADATERVARANVFRRVVPGRRARRADLLTRSVHVSSDLHELTRIRLRGKGEGRGVMVLDEAGGWLNARDWNDPARKPVLEWFRKHRKYGWDVYLLVQDEEQLDKHVRKLFEYHVHLRNLRRMRLLGVSIVPVNLFLALWTWHGLQSTNVVRREVYRLSWHRHLYDTTQVDFGTVDAPADVLWLPRESSGPARSFLDVSPLDVESADLAGSTLSEAPTPLGPAHGEHSG